MGYSFKAPEYKDKNDALYQIANSILALKPDKKGKINMYSSTNTNSEGEEGSSQSPLDIEELLKLLN